MVSVSENVGVSVRERGLIWMVCRWCSWIFSVIVWVCLGACDCERVYEYLHNLSYGIYTCAEVFASTSLHMCMCVWLAVPECVNT